LIDISTSPSRSIVPARPAPKLRLKVTGQRPAENQAPPCRDQQAEIRLLDLIGVA
jgi:hypothetical protein